jgi:acid stress chaperone HdeA
MKAASITLSLLAAGIMAATASQAQQPAGKPGKVADQKKPIAEWTCADFLGEEDVFRPKLIYWASGYSKAGKPGATAIDVKGTENVVPIVADECKRAPQETFLQKLDAAWKSIEKKL